MSKNTLALLALIKRYSQVTRLAWAERHALTALHRTSDELAFLPAHLELMETPSSPAPRRSAWIIMALFSTALLWASLGKLDMVAVASGKTVASSRTKVVQSMETAIVRRILVQEGQPVKAGQLLIELDGTAAATDASKADEALMNARLGVVRATAMVEAIDAGRPPRLAPDASLPADRLHAATQLVSSQYAAFQAKKQGLAAMVGQKQAELHTVESAIEPLEQYLEISRTRVADYEKLLDKNYVPRQEYLVRKQERINAERDLASQRSRRQELLSAIAAARDELSVNTGDARKQYLDELRQAREQIQQYQPEVVRTAQRNRLMQLRAPVAGTVQQLDVHTVGGVVTPAQPLLSVVPDDDALEVEATVLNRDIGFIRPGQTATVKVESFPYTRYGFLEGTLESVSHDAIQDDKLGLVYRARVRLARPVLRVDGVDVKLSSGMALTVEIKTGRRRVINYLLDPLRQGMDESMRER